MNDEQVASVKRFVDQGGGVFATGESSLYNQYGDRRSDYALCDLFGAHYLNQDQSNSQEPIARRTSSNYHTHLRLTPELGKNVDGPKNGTEPEVTGERHPVFKGFDKTDIIPFGGLLEPVTVDPGARVLMTFIPSCPTMPPEDAWMRVKKTDIQGLIINITKSGSRVVFMPADIDRQFARNNYPDHGNLLANIIRWVTKDDIPLSVEGAGLVDCNLYHQPGRMILHISNLISAGTWRAPIDEYIPIGPISVSVKLSEDVKQAGDVKMLVSGQIVTSSVRNGWCQFKINSILNHEVIVIGKANNI
jgi:hypothetical protein